LKWSFLSGFGSRLSKDTGVHRFFQWRFFTSVHGNYLRPSIIAAGLDPNKLNKPEDKKGYFGPSSDKDRPKNWKDIWGAGQGVGSIDDIPTVAALIDRMASEYGEAARRVAMQAARHANNYQTITTEETS
jgi:nitronate monooxygenase